MSNNESREMGKKELKAGMPAAPRAYSAPQLLVLGQAAHLVQGSDSYKMTMDGGPGSGYYDKKR
jgi:hypothetical protein